MKILLLMLIAMSFLSSAEVDFVKVDKSENKMYLLDNIIKEYHVVFGENPKGHKTQVGDEKTPEGIYTLDYKKEDSSFYRAMHISYPNKSDLDNAKRKGFLREGLLWFMAKK